jgi:hypothetical protein
LWTNFILYGFESLAIQHGGEAGGRGGWGNTEERVEIDSRSIVYGEDNGLKIYGERKEEENERKKKS